MRGERGAVRRQTLQLVLALCSAIAGFSPGWAADSLATPNGPAGIAEHAFYRAVELSAAGDSPQAVGLLELAVRAQPNVALYHEALADGYVALGNPDAGVLALAEYRAALELEPGRVRAREGLVQAAVIAGQFGAAIDELDALAFSGELSPGYLTDLITLYLAADRAERGIAKLREVRPAPETRGAVSVGLAALHRAEEQFDQAIERAAAAAADEAAPADVRGLARELLARWAAEREAAP